MLQKFRAAQYWQGKQELVRHIKDEPASLDPAKAVGLPGIRVIRDLFEGLVNQNEKGRLSPALRLPVEK